MHQDSIRNESLVHGDIVQGNFLDSYKNLTYKTVMGHMWVSRFCRQAEFVMKADDDIYLDLYGLYTVAGRYREDQVNIPTGINTNSCNDVPEVHKQHVHDGGGQQVLEGDCQV